MINQILCKINQPGITSVDLLIDELNDHLGHAALNMDEANVIFEQLSDLLETNNNPAVWESVFNLFGSLSERNFLSEKISEVAIRYLHELSPGCLVHAIPIIAESTRLDKKELLSSFLDSTNVAVKNIAFTCMQEI